MSHKRVWSKRQALAFARRINHWFPVKWNITFNFSEEPPAWVGSDADSDLPPDQETKGQYRILDFNRMLAEIWCPLHRSPGSDAAEVIMHEMIHVLFKATGIDTTDMEDDTCSMHVHQVIQSLGDVLGPLLWKAR